MKFGLGLAPTQRTAPQQRSTGNPMETLRKSQWIMMRMRMLSTETIVIRVRTIILQGRMMILWTQIQGIWPQMTIAVIISQTQNQRTVRISMMILMIPTSHIDCIPLAGTGGVSDWVSRVLLSPVTLFSFTYG
jgi:hypothetical protein